MNFLKDLFAKPVLTKDQAFRAASHLTSFAALTNLPNWKVVEMKKRYECRTIPGNRLAASFPFKT